MKKKNRSRVTHQEVVRQRGLKDDFDKLSSGEKAKIDEIYQERDHLNNEAGFKAFHVDHIVPVSKGGKHHPDNLQILTARENLQKKDRLE